MGNLQQVLEKIMTLNINANTNIDIQGIVHQVVLYDTLSKVGAVLLVCLTFLLTVFMWYRYAMKSVEKTENRKAIEKMEEILDSFDNWKRIEELQATVKEVRDYMPRNKKPRKEK